METGRLQVLECHVGDIAAYEIGARRQWFFVLND